MTQFSSGMPTQNDLFFSSATQALRDPDFSFGPSAIQSEMTFRQDAEGISALYDQFGQDTPSFSGPESDFVSLDPETGDYVLGARTRRQSTKALNTGYFSKGYLLVSNEFIQGAAWAARGGSGNSIRDQDLPFQAISPEDAAIFAELGNLGASNLDLTRLGEALPGVTDNAELLHQLITGNKPEGWTPAIQEEIMRAAKPGFMALLDRKGISGAALSNSQNVNDWYFKVFTQLNQSASVASLERYRFDVGGFENFFKATVFDTFVVDGFLNDPDIMADIAIGAAVSAVTAGIGTVKIFSSLAAKGIKGERRLALAYRASRRIQRNVNLGMRLNPITFGDTLAQGLLNKSAGRAFFAQTAQTRLQSWTWGSMGQMLSGTIGGSLAELSNQSNRKFLRLQEAGTINWTSVMHMGLMSGAVAPLFNRTLGLPLHLVTAGSAHLSGYLAKTALHSRISNTLSAGKAGKILQNGIRFSRLFSVNPNTRNKAITKDFFESEAGQTIDTLVDFGPEGGVEQSVIMEVLSEIGALDSEGSAGSQILGDIIYRVRSAHSANTDGKPVDIATLYQIVGDVLNMNSESPALAKMEDSYLVASGAAETVFSLRAEALYRIEVAQKGRKALSRKQFFKNLEQNPLEILQSMRSEVTDVYNKLSDLYIEQESVAVDDTDIEPVNTPELEAANKEAEQALIRRNTAERQARIARDKLTAAQRIAQGTPELGQAVTDTQREERLSIDAVNEANQKVLVARREGQKLAAEKAAETATTDARENLPASVKAEITQQAWSLLLFAQKSDHSIELVREFATGQRTLQSIFDSIDMTTESRENISIIFAEEGTVTPTQIAESDGIKFTIGGGTRTAATFTIIFNRKPGARILDVGNVSTTTLSKLDDAGLHGISRIRPGEFTVEERRAKVDSLIDRIESLPIKSNSDRITFIRTLLEFQELLSASSTTLSEEIRQLLEQFSFTDKGTDGTSNPVSNFESVKRAAVSELQRLRDAPATLEEEKASEVREAQKEEAADRSLATEFEESSDTSETLEDENGYPVTARDTPGKTPEERAKKLAFLKKARADKRAKYEDAKARGDKIDMALNAWKLTKLDAEAEGKALLDEMAKPDENGRVVAVDDPAGKNFTDGNAELDVIAWRGPTQESGAKPPANNPTAETVDVVGNAPGDVVSPIIRVGEDGELVELGKAKVIVYSRYETRTETRIRETKEATLKEMLKTDDLEKRAALQDKFNALVEKSKGLFQQEPAAKKEDVKEDVKEAPVEFTPTDTEAPVAGEQLDLFGSPEETAPEPAPAPEIEAAPPETPVEDVELPSTPAPADQELAGALSEADAESTRASVSAPPPTEAITTETPVVENPISEAVVPIEDAVKNYLDIKEAADQALTDLPDAILEDLQEFRDVTETLRLERIDFATYLDGIGLLNDITKELQKATKSRKRVANPRRNKNIQRLTKEHREAQQQVDVIEKKIAKVLEEVGGEGELRGGKKGVVTKQRNKLKPLVEARDNIAEELSEAERDFFEQGKVKKAQERARDAESILEQALFNLPKVRTEQEAHLFLDFLVSKGIVSAEIEADIIERVTRMEETSQKAIDLSRKVPLTLGELSTTVALDTHTNRVLTPGLTRLKDKTRKVNLQKQIVKLRLSRVMGNKEDATILLRDLLTVINTDSPLVITRGQLRDLIEESPDFRDSTRKALQKKKLRKDQAEEIIFTVFDKFSRDAFNFTSREELLTSLETFAGGEIGKAVAGDPVLNALLDSVSLRALANEDTVEREPGVGVYTHPDHFTPPGRRKDGRTETEVGMETQRTRASDDYVPLDTTIDVNDPAVLTDWATTLRSVVSSLEAHLSTHNSAANPTISGIRLQSFFRGIGAKLTLDGTGGQTLLFRDAIVSESSTAIVPGTGDVSGNYKYDVTLLHQIATETLAVVQERLAKNTDTSILRKIRLADSEFSRIAKNSNHTLEDLIKLSDEDASELQRIGQAVFGGHMTLDVPRRGLRRGSTETGTLKDHYPILSLLSESNQEDGAMFWAAPEQDSTFHRPLFVKLQERLGLKSPKEAETLIKTFARSTKKFKDREGTDAPLSHEEIYVGVTLATASAYLTDRVITPFATSDRITDGRRTKVWEFLRRELRNSGVDMEVYSRDENSADTMNMLRDYLDIVRWNNTDTGNELYNFGNGQISYTPADHLGKALVDYFSGMSEGSTHQSIVSTKKDPTAPKLNENSIGGRPVSSISEKNGFASKLNSAAGSKQAALEKMKETWAVNHKIQHALNVVNASHKNSDGTINLEKASAFTEAVFQWAENLKQIHIVAGATSPLRMLPTLVDPNGRSPIWSREQHIDQIRNTMAQFPSALIDAVHDSVAIGEDIWGAAGDHEGRAFTFKPTLATASFGFDVAIVAPFTVAHSVSLAGSQMGRFAKSRSKPLKQLSQMSLDSWASFVEHTRKNLKPGQTIEEALKASMVDGSYFDSTFNGLQHQMAVAISSTLSGKSTNKTLRAYHDAIQKDFDTAMHEFLAPAGEYSPYMGASYRMVEVMAKHLALGSPSSGASRARVANVMNALVDAGFFPAPAQPFSESTSPAEVDAYMGNLKKVITDSKAPESVALKKLFKNPIMLYLYTARFPSIHNHLKGVEALRGASPEIIKDFAELLTATKGQANAHAAQKLTLSGTKKGRSVLAEGLDLEFTPEQILRAMAVELEKGDFMKLVNEDTPKESREELRDATRGGFSPEENARKLLRRRTSNDELRGVNSSQFMESLLAIRVAEEAAIRGLTKEDEAKLRDVQFKRLKEVREYLTDKDYRNLSAEELAQVQAIVNGLPKDMSPSVDRWNAMSTHAKAVDLFSRVMYSADTNESIDILGEHTNLAFQNLLKRYQNDLTQEDILFIAFGIAPVHNRFYAGLNANSQTHSLGQLKRDGGKANPEDSNIFGFWRLEQRQTALSRERVEYMAAMDLLLRTASMEFSNPDGTHMDSLFDTLGQINPDLKYTPKSMVEDWMQISMLEDIASTMRADTEFDTSNEGVDKKLTSMVARFEIARSLADTADRYNNGAENTIPNHSEIPQGIFMGVPPHALRNIHQSLGVPVLRREGYKRTRDKVEDIVTTAEVDAMIQHNKKATTRAYDTEDLPILISDTQAFRGLDITEVNQENMLRTLTAFAHSENLTSLLPSSDKTSTQIKHDLRKLYFHNKAKQIFQETLNDFRTILPIFKNERSFLTYDVEGAIGKVENDLLADATTSATKRTVIEILTAKLTQRWLEVIRPHISSKNTVVDILEYFPSGKIPTINQDVLFAKDAKGELLDGTGGKRLQLNTTRQALSKLASVFNNLKGINPSGEEGKFVLAPASGLVLNLRKVASKDLIPDVAEGSVYFTSSGDVPVGIQANDAGMMAMIMILSSTFKKYRETGMTFSDGTELSATAIKDFMSGKEVMSKSLATKFVAEMETLASGFDEATGEFSFQLDIEAFSEDGLQFALDEDPATKQKTLRILGGLESADLKQTSAAGSAQTVTKNRVVGGTVRTMLTPKEFGISLINIRNTEFLDRLRLGGMVNAMSIDERIQSDRLKGYDQGSNKDTSDGNQKLFEESIALDDVASMFTGESNNYELVSNLNQAPVYHPKTREDVAMTMLDATSLTDSKSGFNGFLMDTARGDLALAVEYQVITERGIEKLNFTDNELAAGSFLMRNRLMFMDPVAARDYLTIIFPTDTENVVTDKLVTQAYRLANIISDARGLKAAERAGHYFKNPIVHFISNSLHVLARGDSKALVGVKDTPGNLYSRSEGFLFNSYMENIRKTIDNPDHGVGILFTERYKFLLPLLFKNDVPTLDVMKGTDISSFFDPKAVGVAPEIAEFQRELGMRFADAFLVYTDYVSNPTTPTAETSDFVANIPSSLELTEASNSAEGMTKLFTESTPRPGFDGYRLLHNLIHPIEKMVASKVITKEQAVVLRYLLGTQAINNPFAWADTKLYFYSSSEDLKAQAKTDTQLAKILRNKDASGFLLDGSVRGLYGFSKDNTAKGIFLNTRDTGNLNSTETAFAVILHEMSHAMDFTTLIQQNPAMRALFTDLVKKLRKSQSFKKKLQAASTDSIARAQANRPGDILFADTTTLRAGDETAFVTEMMAALLPAYLLSTLPKELLSSIDSSLSESRKSSLNAIKSNPDTEIAAQTFVNHLVELAGSTGTSRLFQLRENLDDLFTLSPELGIIMDKFGQVLISKTFDSSDPVTPLDKPAALKGWDASSESADIADATKRMAEIGEELRGTTLTTSERTDLTLERDRLTAKVERSDATNALGVPYKEMVQATEDLKAKYWTDDGWAIHAIMKDPFAKKVWFSGFFDRLNEHIGEGIEGGFASVLNKVGLSAESQIGSILRRFMVAPSHSQLHYDSTIGAVLLLSGFIAQDFRVTTGLLNSNEISSITQVRERVMNQESSIISRYQNTVQEVKADMAKETLDKILMMSLIEAAPETFTTPGRLTEDEIKAYEKNKESISKLTEQLLGHLQGNVVTEGLKAGLLRKNVEYAPFPLKLSQEVTKNPERVQELHGLLQEKMKEHLLSVVESPTTQSLTQMSTSIAYAGGLLPRLSTKEAFFATWETFAKKYSKFARHIENVTGAEFAKNPERLFEGAQIFLRSWENNSLTKLPALEALKEFYADYRALIQSDSFDSVADKSSRLGDITELSKTLLGRGDLRSDELYTGITEPSRLIMAQFLSDVGTGSYFVRKKSRDFPAFENLMFESSDGSFSEVTELFSTDVKDILNGVARTIHYDALATNELMKLTDAKGYTFPNLMDDLISVVDSNSFLDVNNGGKAHDKELLKNSFNYMKDVYVYAAGRKLSYAGDKGQADNILSGTLAKNARDLTVIAYGNNLTLATLMVEGTLSAISSVITPGALTKPFDLLRNLFAPLDPIARRELAEDMAYGQYFSGQGIIRGLDWQTAADIKNQKEGLGRVLGPWATMMLKPSQHINKRLRMAQSSVFRNRFLKRWRDGSYRNLKKVVDDNPKISTVKDIKRVTRESKFGYLHRAEVVDVLESGMLEHLDSIDEMMALTGDNFSYKKFAEELIYPALARGEEKGTRWLEAFDAIREMEAKHLDSVFIANHPLDADLTNSGWGFIFKMWRQYPTSFSAQRIRRDMFKYPAPVWAARILAHAVFDGMYMLLLRLAAGYALEDEIQRIKEDPVLSLSTLLVRTPMFGLAGNILLEGLLRGVIAAQGKPQSQFFGGAFSMIPGSALDAPLKILIDIAKLIKSKNAGDKAKAQKLMGQLGIDAARILPILGGAHWRVAANFAGVLPIVHGDSVTGHGGARPPANGTRTGGLEMFGHQVLANPHQYKGYPELLSILNEFGIKSTNIMNPGDMKYLNPASQQPDLYPGIASDFANLQQQGTQAPSPQIPKEAQGSSDPLQTSFKPAAKITKGFNKAPSIFK